MASKILLGLAFILAGCGGAGNETKTVTGRWSGWVFTTQVYATQLTIDQSKAISGTVGGNPATGTAGPNYIVLDGVGHFRYTLDKDKIEGLYISLQRQ